MKVKMKTSFSGPDWNCKPGDICEVEDGQAKRFIKAGHAEAITQRKQSKDASSKANKTKETR